MKPLRRGDIKFTRLAVVPAQIDELQLPKTPAKLTDRRSFEGETTQCESIQPDVLATIIRGAIEARLDVEAYTAVLNAEGAARETLANQLQPLLHDFGGAA